MHSQDSATSPGGSLSKCASIITPMTTGLNEGGEVKGEIDSSCSFQNGFYQFTVYGGSFLFLMQLENRKEEWREQEIACKNTDLKGEGGAE